jgi:precorrin-6B methylase 2
MTTNEDCSKYPFLKDIRFVGDLSLQDANILSEISKNADVLEFGSGGSTQIFAQCANTIVSVETEHLWIDKTKKNLNLLGAHAQTKFVSYDLFKPTGKYDVIFVDGVLGKRLAFATDTWSLLKTSGKMVFHDTRHFENFKEVAWIMQLYFKEVSRVEINYKDSNLTIVQKREPLEYINWNNEENKPKWAYGIEEKPEGIELWKINN